MRPKRNVPSSRRRRRSTPRPQVSHPVARTSMARCSSVLLPFLPLLRSTEDMDALTFRTPKLVRRLTFAQGGSKDKQQPILELDLELVLKGLDVSYEQFVDLCILCGCDYSTTIKGIGPKTVTTPSTRHPHPQTLLLAPSGIEAHQAAPQYRRRLSAAEEGKEIRNPSRLVAYSSPQRIATFFRRRQSTARGV